MGFSAGIVNRTVLTILCSFFVYIYYDSFQKAFINIIEITLTISSCRELEPFEIVMVYFLSTLFSWRKGTGHHVVGDEKTSVTMVLNKILWLEINANTSSNERMPARHRSL